MPNQSPATISLHKAVSPQAKGKGRSDVSASQSNTCIGIELQPITVRGRRKGPFLEWMQVTVRCWDADGPPVLSYREISEKVRYLLDVDEGRDGDLRDQPCSVGFYMVGVSEELARPAIIIHCPSSDRCRRITRLIKDTKWWMDFKKRNPTFIILHSATAPRARQLAGALDMRQEPPSRAYIVYTFENLQGYCGAPIFISPAGTPPSLRSQKATMGGIIFLDGVPYGMTVAHACSHFVSNAAVAENEVPPEICFLDEDDYLDVFEDKIWVNSPGIKHARRVPRIDMLILT